MYAMSFGAIADDYDRLRPDPAPEAVEWLLPDHWDQVVDLAAGTGKLTRALASQPNRAGENGRAGRVIAVEPDGRMGAVLRSRSPEVGVTAGVGEAIPLATASADGLFVSSAWHWLTPELAVPEIARVLRDGGRFGVIWTSRDREVGWLRQLDLIREPGLANEVVDTKRHQHRTITLPEPGQFTGIETASFGYARPMAVDDVVEMVGTYSKIIVATQEDRAGTLARVRAALDELFPGAAEIEVPIRSLCWRATRVARADC